MVASGDRTVVLAGAGTVNGQGDDRLVLWVDDDRPDSFRVEIWAESDGVETVIYDNGPDRRQLWLGSIVVRPRPPWWLR